MIKTPRRLDAARPERARRRPGLTLVELLVVVAVVGLLLAITLPAVQLARGGAAGRMRQPFEADRCGGP